MKNLQLTDKYTLWGLTEEEYRDVNTFIDQKINLTPARSTEQTDEQKTELKQLCDLFIGLYGFDLNTIVGDTDLKDGVKSIPTKVAEEIVEHYHCGDVKVYKCFAKTNWKEFRPGLDVNLHEDAHSSLNCALNILRKPYAIIITKKPEKTSTQGAS